MIILSAGLFLIFKNLKRIFENVFTGNELIRLESSTHSPVYTLTNSSTTNIQKYIKNEIQD